MAQDNNIVAIPPREIARRKTKKFAAAINKELDKIDPESGERRWMCVARKVVDAAIAGDMEAVRIIADRTDGKPVPSQEELDSQGIKVVVLNNALRPPRVHPTTTPLVISPSEPLSKILETPDFSQAPPTVPDFQNPERELLEAIPDADIIDANTEDDYR